MAIVNLSAVARTESGKGAARKLRSSGQVPATIYGSAREAQSLTINEKDLDRLLGTIAAESTVIELGVDGGRPTKTLIREIQRHPFKRQILHVDFQELVAGEKITVNIPLVLVGMPDAVRLSALLEGLEPYFVEDLVRSENPSVYRQLRQQVKVPIAVGEQFGDRWDINELIEQHLIDYNRITIPNCGGITEYLKQAALCETHYVGLTPHFTGPVSEAALVQVCTAFSGPVLMEMAGVYKNEIPYLPRHFDFKDGKLWPNDRPGLGVEIDA